MIKANLKLLGAVLQNTLSKAVFLRTPEPEVLITDPLSVSEYAKAEETNMSVIYAMSLDYIHRIVPQEIRDKAIDLCCGPGVCTSKISSLLEFNDVIGVDLSEPMLNSARKNYALKTESSNLSFKKLDITKLDSVYEKAQFNLVTFMCAAHHFQTLQDVRSVISQAENVCTDNGYIIIIDLARLKTKQVTDKYIQLMGEDYLKSGYTSFYNEFKNSMYAAWTTEELASCVSPDTRKKWYQLSPMGLPTLQLIVGIPPKKSVFNNPPLSQTVIKKILSKEPFPQWSYKALTRALTFSKLKTLN